MLSHRPDSGARTLGPLPSIVYAIRVKTHSPLDNHLSANCDREGDEESAHMGCSGQKTWPNLTTQPPVPTAVPTAVAAHIDLALMVRVPQCHLYADYRPSVPIAESFGQRLTLQRRFSRAALAETLKL